MLILSTYRVVLHPSYLQKVFSFIILIKERYSFMILSENSRAPGGAPWAELKSDEHLSADCQQNSDIWCCFTYRLQLWIMTGIFYSWDFSIFQYQTMCKSSVELGLVYKTFVNKHTCETLLPRKTNGIHCSRNAGFFGKLNKVIFPLQPKTHFFRDILPEQVLFSAAEWSVDGRALPLVYACAGAFFWEKCPFKELNQISVANLAIL